MPGRPLLDPFSARADMVASENPQSGEEIPLSAVASLSLSDPAHRAASGSGDDALSHLASLVAVDLAACNKAIIARMDSSVGLIPQLAAHLVAAGGKRLRPALLLLMCGALGYRGEQRYNLAAVVEFIHTATLLHDDVVDESTLRRGRATANEAFGNPASVLVGDFLYSRAFQMMVEAGDMRVMQTLAGLRTMQPSLLTSLSCAVCCSPPPCSRPLPCRPKSRSTTPGCAPPWRRKRPPAPSCS